MHSDKIRIRKGKLADKRIVESFTRDTFSWGDYVPRVWNQWVRSKRGELLVAEVNHVLAGALHVRYLESGEAWLEGVRVRANYRKQGIASHLIQSAHERAKANKCRVIRLETGSHNLAGQRTFEKHGYQRIVEYAGWQARAQQGACDNIHPARISDIPACWKLWLESRQCRVARGIVPADWGWRWWTFSRGRLRGAIRDKRVWVTSDLNLLRGFMIVRQDDSFDVTLLIGSQRAAKSLLNAARIIAANLHRESVYWLAPHAPQARAWAGSTGYAQDDAGLLIYQAELR